ncbi:type III pantothenate kinase [Aquirufa regiilacus]|uniref:type III pantothenate kinase n=1 Tax=Aquirufa regiilacus TaxID=3024868 RepID=UPI0028DF5960|nr:type III pantothenate kinase [Aquirufa sp. LEPPI-3A]MDT8886059.1 type III pantothenate kinase [Aquirufa sp. LEPPI-3A]
MKLLLDFGNTRLKYAVYEGHTKINAGIIADLTVESIRQIPYFAQVESIHLSTVIDIPSPLSKLFSAKLVPNQLVIPGKDYDVSSLGEDRILLALGAGPSHLTICLGTCITYNLTDESHAFVGGAISPGIGMRGKAMHEQTAKLPHLIPQMNYPHFGDNTASNLLAGVMAGVEFEIKGFVEEAQKRIPNLQIVLTGGDAQYFEHLYPVDPDLVWKGMLI